MDVNEGCFWTPTIWDFLKYSTKRRETVLKGPGHALSKTGGRPYSQKKKKKTLVVNYTMHHNLCSLRGQSELPHCQFKLRLISYFSPACKHRGAHPHVHTHTHTHTHTDTHTQGTQYDTHTQVMAFQAVWARLISSLYTFFVIKPL